MSQMLTRFLRLMVLGILIQLVAWTGPQLKLEPIPATANPTDEIVDLIFHRLNLDLGIQQARGTNDQLGDVIRGVERLETELLLI